MGATIKIYTIEVSMIQEKLITFFQDSLNNYWDLPAFSDYHKETFTYRECSQHIKMIHRVFDLYGMKKGDKIALCGKNSARWAITYLAAVTYGAVIVPILSNFSSHDIQHIINHSEARLLFIQDDVYENIDESQLHNIEAIFDLKDFSNLKDKKKKWAKQWEAWKNEDSIRMLAPGQLQFDSTIDNSSLGVIIYTSGTTGFSKGVMLSHNNLMANMIVARENLLFRVGDKVLSFLPLAHAYACSFDLLYPFSRGNHIHFLDKMPSPKVLLAAMNEVKPSVVLAVPLIIEKIYKKNIIPEIEKPLIKTLIEIPWLNKLIFKKIRNKLLETFGGNLIELVVGGAPINPEVEFFLKKISFPFVVGYGMTECAPLVSYARWFDHKPRSAGRIVKFMEAKIDSPDPTTIPGEIMLKGEQVTCGYFHNDEATKEVFRNGYLCTGDIGTLTKDNFIFINGRSKNMLLGPSGENIYPEEIEQKISNLPFILESLVVTKDSKVVALVYPDYEALDLNKLKESELPRLMEENRKRLNSQLSDFSKVQRIEVVSEPFQKTPTQKIKRYLYQ